MSAWYIFSALGFYPVNPVSREYIVGTYVHREPNNHPTWANVQLRRQTVLR